MVYTHHALGANGSIKPYVVRLAPPVWKQKHLHSPDPHETQEDYNPERSICSSESRAAWAWLIAKVYEVNPLEFSRLRLSDEGPGNHHGLKSGAFRAFIVAWRSDFHDFLDISLF